MRHGSKIDPPNRFEKVRREPDPEFLDWDREHAESTGDRAIEYLFDSSQSIISENHSPDIPFRYSLNPYRGCVHGCAYCYARPTHEYLGLNAGLDFETRIVVKKEAARLFREFLGRPNWKPQPIAFSGVTDCYQPAEREFRLTRDCLAVAVECRQPVSIVTKNALVTRDVDLLKELATLRLVHVYVSITTLESELARTMEPRTSVPMARLRAMEMLAQAGIPVGVMVAPLIPGLNDAEIPAILAAAQRAGAKAAGFILLRLPLTVEPVFREWLHRTQPLKADKILGRVQATREGNMNSSKFGDRMRGTGPIAEQIGKLFQVFRRKHGLANPLEPQNCDAFQPPRPASGQLRLF